MDLASRKYRFIERLRQVVTTEQLDKLEAFFNSEISTTESTDVQELPLVAKKLLQQSKEELINGNSITHKEVMQSIKVKYKL